MSVGIIDILKITNNSASVQNSSISNDIINIYYSAYKNKKSSTAINIEDVNSKCSELLNGYNDISYKDLDTAEKRFENLPITNFKELKDIANTFNMCIMPIEFVNDIKSIMTKTELLIFDKMISDANSLGYYTYIIGPINFYDNWSHICSETSYMYFPTKLETVGISILATLNSSRTMLGMIRELQNNVVNVQLNNKTIVKELNILNTKLNTLAKLEEDKYIDSMIAIKGLNEDIIQTLKSKPKPLDIDPMVIFSKTRLSEENINDNIQFSTGLFFGKEFDNIFIDVFGLNVYNKQKLNIQQLFYKMYILNDKINYLLYRSLFKAIINSDDGFKLVINNFKYFRRDILSHSLGMNDISSNTIDKIKVSISNFIDNIIKEEIMFNESFVFDYKPDNIKHTITIDFDVTNTNNSYIKNIVIKQ